ncbi:hypothetical protein F5J12DRAFT_899133 [Pisolithus orientalis]|uniref:uncharacterized protein n=1 Tax=Pisolithus orientalis TaxID=936130 RepID=UPI0022246362|nr:uncharacterized protein F5J12DRAFT_899133 [Pisolithus orientalis]KAI5984964.1 hypothetical protein F5J12DRAFT_899133 [Pisolithus orientalis]
MGLSRNSRGKYNYSEETLSTLHICWFCSKQFKVQGIKRHKTGCKKQQELQKEQAERGKEFERERCKEIALDAGLNKTQVNGLLELFLLVTKGMEQAMMKNDAELQKACDNAGAELTPFTKHVISVPYKGKEMEFEVHTWPVWDWALDLLANPQLAPHFVWDTEWVYKHNGEEYECFYGEPWTCDRWWDIQSQLPADVENAIPFCFILYADKTRLSSHSTVKEYPVVVWCANLPVDIQNSESIGGGCVVSWLPIVPEDAAEEGKLGYTTLKCVVWHESAIKLFEAMVHFSATGFQHRCWDKIIWYLFPLFLILSVDYEEQ